MTENVGGTPGTTGQPRECPSCGSLDLRMKGAYLTSPTYPNAECQSCGTGMIFYRDWLYLNGAPKYGYVRYMKIPMDTYVKYWEE